MIPYTAHTYWSGQEAQVTEFCLMYIAIFFSFSGALISCIILREAALQTTEVIYI